MKLYNTASQKIEDVAPQAAPKITVYTCGPTVYDYPHIGNWFTFIRYDILVRALKIAGFEPDWVMNITDVGHLVSDEDEGEDKLEKGARREGKTAWEIASYYGDNFESGMMQLNFLTPRVLPKATDHIAEQIELIKRLEEKGFTYKIDDGIYFDTAKLADYGKLAHLDVDKLKAGARVEVNPQKLNPTDFALWKFSPPGRQRDMEWDSPWGKGFPGWHIECSAMSMKYLGATLDLHAGGIDHIPVHHTNEIAQSEAATGQPFVRHWLHANHILIGGEKIAKSLGNGFALEDLAAKGFTPMDLRMLVLESHYRTQSMFSWETLDAAHNRLQNFRAAAVLRFQPQDGEDHQDWEALIRSDIYQPLLDDLDTPRVLTNIGLRFDSSATVGLNFTNSEGFKKYLEAIDSALGLNLADEPDISEDIKSRIREREAARKVKDWQKSDSLRDELRTLGIGLNDTDDGQTLWYRL